MAYSLACKYRFYMKGGWCWALTNFICNYIVPIWCVGLILFTTTKDENIQTFTEILYRFSFQRERARISFCVLKFGVSNKIEINNFVLLMAM